MDFLISAAYAQDGAAAGGNPLVGMLFPIALIAIFYFLLIRPQAKRAKEHKKMVEAIAKGDEVVTQGGILGKVTEVGDNFLGVEIAGGVEVRVQKAAVASLMPKGTYRQTEKKTAK
ncbi:MAG TPA: preprotein translocase subunit YajC [Gammaproteobacteria bacterium]|nr:preprotein translocase subunit YajC [Gammaproteobacteria bacterium]